MSGENFKSVAQMLNQMQAFVEKTEQDLKQGRDRVGELRNQYQTLTQNAEVITQFEQERSVPPVPKAISAKAEIKVPKQPVSAASAPTEEVEHQASSKRVLRASQPDSEPPQEIDIKHESTERTYLRK